MNRARDRYILEHSTPQNAALEWIERQTFLHTNFPQMLSGPVQGRFIGMLSSVAGARRILEIGTFTGYSAAAIALTAPQAHIDTLEINDELESIAREGWERAGVADRIHLHIGDARDTLSALAERGCIFDLVYIDANKREYLQYYEAVLPMLCSGALILADDVMQGGKVYDENPASDAQTSALLAFNDAVRCDSRVEVVMLPIRDGLSIIRKL